MFLKRLDVVGFKSFAERISVEFVPGVTAVVGPNGSGKSNITDAIRWVLGEQSARSLRGSKMEDIIFAGSDSRKSLNVAEVTLTLQNDDHFLPVDYHEVSVTRRVYRSGESEFYINKQSCRLKDIVELFMDSGLGREAFSIISQGKVEEILSSKAEERRSIFEEAAGVLKYKQRKKKAEMKLFDTQENLNRVEDIIHEIEGQIEPLKEQSAVAKDYLEKKEELEKTEVSLLAYEIEDLHKKWDGSLKQLEQLKDEEVRFASLIQKEESEITSLRETMVTLDESINDLQEVLLLSSQELEKLEGQKEVLKERKKNATENESQLVGRIDLLKSKVESHQALIDQETETYRKFEQELNDSKLKLEQAEHKMQAVQQNIEEEIEELKSEYIDILNRQASNRNEKNYLEQQLLQHQGKKGRLDEQNKQFLDKRNDVDQRKQEIESLLTAKKEDIQKKKHELESNQLELSKKFEEYEKRQTQLYKAYQYIQQYQSKKEMLEDLQEDYSGFFHGVKSILKSGIQGIEGAVAEIVKVEKQYETAIEIALGSAMQHVVVDTEENARKAIQYLKQTNSGRATLLPLTVIKGREISESQLFQLKNHPAFIGIGAHLVSFQERYQEVVKNLLGHVIISKDLKGANELARLVNFRYRIVTLEGDVVNPGGAMTGGSLKKNTNSLLGRGRELEDITEKLSEVQEKTAKFEKQVKGLKEETVQGQEYVESIKRELEQLRLEEQSLESKIREIMIEEKNINERLSIYDHEMKSFSEDQHSLNQRLDEIETLLNESSEKTRELEKQIEQLNEKKKLQDTSKEELQSEVTNLKVVVAEKQQLLKGQSEKLERTEQEFHQLQTELKQTEEDYQFLRAEMTTNSSGEGQLSEQITMKQQEKEKTIELISSRREERLQLQTKQQDIEHELKEQKRQHRQIQMTLKDEEVKANRLDVELENRLEQLRAEYMLTFEAAREKYPEIENVDEARMKVKLIKKGIEELGRVNLGAIDEYERISERFTFLSEQRDDLIEAKTTLHQVIGEMDEEMKKRFETSFYSIKEQFEKVFVQLFGGGRADLRLTDPDDLLNTGVDIVAQPPGKKLQNLGLLSGGERALTAIALLFAILHVRPVPFCVLDEVEAALDDANVSRFAMYLKKFSAETQFIVITHRKGTMEEADVLYGVTMQESGVSRLVSVKLEESKEFVN